MKPHQRGNLINQKKPPGKSAAADPNRPVFFYMPNETPYGIFCQWYSSPFSAPIASLEWLSMSHPRLAKSTATTSTSTSSPSQSQSQTDTEKDRDTDKGKSPQTRRTILFTCAEQFMMYAKALYFHDPITGTKIMDTSDPKEQKRLGREVKSWDDYLWLGVCERVAFEGNWWKFGGLGEEGRYDKGYWRKTLLETGGRELCEASSKDRRWGIGYNERNAMMYRVRWGANLLGKALMMVREKIGERVKEIEEGRKDASDWELPAMEW